MPLVTKLNKEVKSTEELVHNLTLTFESNKYVKRELPKEADEFWELDGAEEHIRQAQPDPDRLRQIDQLLHKPSRPNPRLQGTLGDPREHQKTRRHGPRSLPNQ